MIVMATTAIKQNNVSQNFNRKITGYQGQQVRTLFFWGAGRGGGVLTFFFIITKYP
jgi:hypothetical protein